MKAQVSLCKCVGSADTLLPAYTKYGCRPDQTHLEEEEKASSFAFVVLQMYCYYKCSVALPHGAVCWSAVCDCGIS